MLLARNPASSFRLLYCVNLHIMALAGRQFSRISVRRAGQTHNRRAEALGVGDGQRTSVSHVLTVLACTGVNRTMIVQLVPAFTVVSHVPPAVPACRLKSAGVIESDTNVLRPVSCTLPTRFAKVTVRSCH